MVKEPPTDDVRAAGFLLLLRPDDNVQEFLLMKHTDRWDLPKGHCEEGESFLQTALRETAEETGISSEQISVDADFQFDCSYPVTYKRWGNRVLTKQVRYFLGILNRRPELNLTEHKSAQWFAWKPPHSIQTQTIDPLLAAVDQHLKRIG